MYKQVLQQIINERGSMNKDELLIFTYQLAAWIKLSKQDRLNDELNFTKKNNFEFKNISDIFREISDSQFLEANSSAFSYVNPAIQHISYLQLQTIIEWLAECDFNNPWDAEDLINRVSNPSLVRLPSELTQLIISLAQMEKEEDIYLPFENSFQLTVCAQKESAKTYSETPVASALPWLINILCNMKMNVFIGDSIQRQNIGFLTDDGKLTKYSVSAAFPPPNLRYDNVSELKTDLYNRFPEPTNSIAVLAIRVLMARTIGLVVIGVPNGVLFSNGAERALRDDLLAKRQIESVITLPPALLQGTAMSFSLLVLKLDSPCDQILFVNGCDESFYAKDGKNRATLSGWKSVLELTKERVDSQVSKLVSVVEVQKNDAQLQVSRYCKSEQDGLVETFLNRYDNKPPIDDIVSFIRPLPMSSQDVDGEVTTEIGLADFPQYGYVVDCSKEIKLSINNRTKNHFLKALDIVMTIKGKVGQVALLPPDMDSKCMVLGQSCIALRINDKGTLNPIVLFNFLKSEVGQVYLKQIVSGSTVQLIQLRELERLSIPIPSREEQDEIIRIFDKTVVIEKNIKTLRDEQNELIFSIFNF